MTNKLLSSVRLPLPLPARLGHETAAPIHTARVRVCRLRLRSNPSSAKWAREKSRPGDRHGPRSWNWFFTVVGAEFSLVERGRWPEPLRSRCAISTAPTDESSRGIEAIEFPDAPDALVCSYRCRCGAEIRQYLSRVVGNCTCQARRPSEKEATAGLASTSAILSRAAAVAT